MAAPARPASPSAPVAERRLASVLFVDLVSYTVLSESRDTEEVRELLSRYFEVCSTLVRRYGGTVEKFIGDAVMAVWGVPTAHEDDAERAVRAALELVGAVSALGEQLALPELAARAGVVTGEVAANLAATDQGMVAGDSVNTAARVQSAAGAGEVWVDTTTRELTSAAVTYDDVGLHALKGKAERMHLYRAGTVVAAIGGQQRVDGLEAPLAGRDRELRLLKELFHATEEAGRPRLVVLDGDAGAGKSRLGWEFEKYVDGLKTSVVWNRGRCLSYGEGVAFWALAEAVRARVGVAEEQRGQAVLDAIDRQLLESVPEEEERSWLRPRVASLLGEGAGGFEREDLFAAWRRFFERVGAGDPVVFLVDDAQHADAGLLDFVESVLADSRSPIFVLMLARPELLEAHPQLGGRRTSVVHLDPLPEPAMAALVDGLVDGFPGDVRDELVKRSEGVPLYAVETVRALIDRELVLPREGRYVVNPARPINLAEVGAPASLHALVAARLDALGPAERRVIGDASVLGEYFTRADIGVLAEDVGDLDGVLAGLQRKELITTDVDRFSAERGQFRFVQSVVRQVAYSTLSRRDRKARHLQVADHLEGLVERQPGLGLVAAQHLIDAVDASTQDDRDVPALNERAAGLLVQAGDRATRLGGHADALRAYREAAQRLRDDRARAAAWSKAAQSALDVGRLGDCIELADQALARYDELGDDLGAARAGAIQARAHQMRGELTACVEVATRAYQRVSDDDPAALGIRAEASATLGRAAMASGGDDALPHLGQALRFAEAAGDERALVRAMSTLATFSQAQWSISVGEALLRQVVEIARTRELWQQLTHALVNSALITRLRSLVDGSRMLEEAVACAREHGLDPRAPSVNLAASLWGVGRWRELEQLLADMREDWPEVSPGDQIIFEATVLWCRRAGRPIDLLSAEGTSDELNWQSWDAHLQALRAAASGDTVRAGEQALRCLQLSVEDAGMSDDYVVQVPRMVRVAVECGQLEAAAAMVAQLEGAPRSSAVAGLHAYARVFRGLLGAHAGTEPARVEADLRAGIEMLEHYGAVPDRALAQEDLGRWLVEHGRAREGAALLEAARATYDELGASAWLQRVETSMPTVSGERR
ncbi:MAG TPA: adenylate/guanylate cyclase domain-containing protein [Marmoricola sp.]|nr:adenylate/guanylate cyclase domain-containing protein [Marmoricola sp.]